MVWEYVSTLIRDKEKVKNSIETLKNKIQKDRFTNKNIYDRIMVEKGEVEIKQNKLLDLFTDSKISKEALELKFKELKDREETLVRDISRLKSEMERVDDLDALGNEIENLCAEYQKKIKNPPFELRRTIVQKWIEEISIMDDGRIKFKVRIPEGEDTNFIKFNTLSLSELFA